MKERKKRSVLQSARADGDEVFTVWSSRIVSEGIGEKMLTRRQGVETLQAFTMFALLFDLEDYATTYRATRDAYLKAANELKLATGPYKAARDAYVAATATYTKSLYE